MPRKTMPAGPGRPKGLPNKSTKNAREAIAAFVDGNSDKLNQWLDEIYAEDGPKSAFQCFSDLLEYHVPKLARTEIVGDEKNPVSVKDVTDIKSKLLKAIPQDQLDAILTDP